MKADIEAATIDPDNPDRMGDNLDNRTRLILAALDIVDKDGPAAVTARRLAEAVGLKRQIVHYYFGTIDELLIAVMRHGFEETRAALEAALRDDDPVDVIRRVYAMAIPASTEFVALALRNDAIAEVYRELTVAIRALYSETLETLAMRDGITFAIEPAGIVFMLQTLSQGLGVEAALGISAGHMGADQAIAWLTERAIRPPRTKHD